MEDIDGGLHPAVDRQSLDEDEVIVQSLNLVLHGLTVETGFHIGQCKQDKHRLID